MPDHVLLSGKRALPFVVENAEHFQALGITRVDLLEDEQELPWDQITDVKLEGTNIDTGYRFQADCTATLPCGIDVRWNVWFESDRDFAPKLIEKNIARVIDLVPESFLPQLSAALDGHAQSCFNKSDDDYRSARRWVERGDQYERLAQRIERKLHRAGTTPTQ